MIEHRMHIYVCMYAVNTYVCTLFIVRKSNVLPIVSCINCVLCIHLSPFHTYRKFCLNLAIHGLVPVTSPGLPLNGIVRPNFQ